LEEKTKGWLGTRPYSKTGEFNPQTGEHIVWIEPVGVPPQDIPLVAGDCLFNLRCVLDHLAYSLAITHTGEPLPPEMAKSSQFPIFNDPIRYRQQRKTYIGGIHPDAQAIIDGLQPHVAGKDSMSHPLSVLAELNNIDKHRSLHLTLTSQVNTGLPFIPGTYIQYIHVTNAGPLKGKTEVARYKALTLDRSMAVNMDLLFAFDVTFASSPIEALSVFGTCRGIRRWIISDVCDPLRKFL
jgi:hypothetical protein